MYISATAHERVIVYDGTFNKIKVIRSLDNVPQNKINEKEVR